jgi:hypothetical protein
MLGNFEVAGTFRISVMAKQAHFSALGVTSRASVLEYSFMAGRFGRA